MKTKKITQTIALAIILAVATFLAIIPFISAQTNSGYCRGMMSGFYGSYGAGIMIIWWIIAILIMLLIVAAIYWLIKSTNKKDKKR